jgi:hypothetical protein
LAPKWLTVARNAYRIHTSRIRRIRRYFPLLVVSALTFYVAFIAPAVVAVLLDEFTALLLSQAAVAVMQIVLFTIFVYFMVIPIANTLREEQTGQLEIFLAAPVKPSDVLLGEYLGVMPFYAIFVTVITGLIAGLLAPLGLGSLQLIIIVLLFVVTFLSAFWIGTVIAAVLRVKLGRTARGKDVGRALAMFLALPMVALIYGMQFGGVLQALADPGTRGMVKMLLGLLPSSWGSEIIVRFALNPGNLGAVAVETFVRFMALVLFFGVSLLLGGKAADRLYSLEPTTFISSTAKPDGAFYRAVRRVGGGGSFGTLLVSLFKDYSRRLENLSNLTYMVGLIVMMNIFIIPGASSSDDGLNAVDMSLMLTQFVVPIIVVMVTGDVTVQGKATLFIYRKAPAGEGRLVRAMLVKSWLMAIPIVGVTTIGAVFSAAQPNPLSLVTVTGLMVLYVAAHASFVLGLFLLNPAYSYKSMKLGVNIMIAIFVSIGLFAASLFLLTRGFVRAEPIGGIRAVQALQTALSVLVGTVVLTVGKRQLSRIE